jgi:hypothetical protein
MLSKYVGLSLRSTQPTNCVDLFDYHTERHWCHPYMGQSGDAVLDLLQGLS